MGELKMPNDQFYGWKLLAVFWAVIFLNFAFPTFGMSVVNTDMARAMHLDRKELGLAYSAFSLMAGLPGPLVGLSINKFGIRFTQVVGSLLVACGALLMALVVHTAVQAILILGVFVGFGAAMSGTIAPQVGMARWFHQKRAFAISTLLTASGIGGFAAVPILNRIIATAGGNWRAAWWCMGSMSLAAALVAAIFIKESPAQMGQTPDGIAPADARVSVVAAGSKPRSGVFKTTEMWSLGEVLRSPTLWLLIPTYLGFFAGFFIFIAHGISHLEGLGHSRAAAAESLSVLLLSSLIGQFAMAVLGDRVEPRYIFAVAVCLFGFGIWLATRAVSAESLYPYAICMGSGFGAAFTGMATILSNYYGPKIYPLVLGVTTPVGTIVGAMGPVAAGYFYDKYGTYNPVFSAIAGLCFASAILLMFAKPPVRNAARSKIATAPQVT
jgi:MFS family permease